MTLQQQVASGAESKPKTTLFCPECGHESDVAGDWIVRDGRNGKDTDERTHTCPVCETTIESRRRPDPLCA